MFVFRSKYVGVPDLANIWVSEIYVRDLRIFGTLTKVGTRHTCSSHGISVLGPKYVGVRDFREIWSGFTGA